MTKVLAPLPGSVMIQHVEDGDRVEAGDLLLQIECMKMLNDVQAPCAGVVRFLVPLGRVVGKGELVAEIT